MPSPAYFVQRDRFMKRREEYLRKNRQKKELFTLVEAVFELETTHARLAYAIKKGWLKPLKRDELGRNVFTKEDLEAYRIFRHRGLSLHKVGKARG